MHTPIARPSRSVPLISPILLLLCALAGCASAPDPVPPAPTPGQVPQLRPAPSPPSKTARLLSARQAPPALPEARREGIEEVFHDLKEVIGAPEDFALQPKEVVVVALPEKLSLKPDEARRTRVQLATAFLGAGHQTKDAGIYKETTFRTNTWPEGDDRTRVSETVRTGDEGATEVVTRTTSDSQPWYWSSWLAWRNDRGLRLDLRDPTSLWIKHLGKYDAIKSRFFLRIFDMKFEADTAQVQLANQLAAEDVAAYRKALAAHNQSIDLYTRDRNQYLQSVARYNDEHERRKTENEQTLRNYESAFARQWQSYEQTFRTWRQRNPESPARPEKQPSLELPAPIQSRYTASTPPPRNKVGEQALQALLEDAVLTPVPITRLMVLAEVVDTKSGDVAWAGEFRGYTRAGTGDRVRLLQSFIQTALH